MKSSKVFPIIITIVAVVCITLICVAIYKLERPAEQIVEETSVPTSDVTSNTEPDVTATPKPTATPYEAPEPDVTATPKPTATPNEGPKPYSSTEKNIPYTREGHHYEVSLSFGNDFRVEDTYYIVVSLNSQIVKVYARNSLGEPEGEPVRTFLTSTGLKDNKSMATPVAQFVILDNDVHGRGKTRWCQAVGGVYVQYATRLYKVNNITENGTKLDGYYTGFMFHSGLYKTTDKSTLDVDEWNLLGYPRSHGCMRLQAADAKWIYENCHTGSFVDIIDGESEPELWKKLKPAKLSGTTIDPTDN